MENIIWFDRSDASDRSNPSDVTPLQPIFPIRKFPNPAIRFPVHRLPFTAPSPRRQFVFLPTPAKGKIHDLSRRLNAGQGIQGMLQNDQLLGLVEGFAQGVAERPFEKHRTRRPNLFRIFSDNGKAHGGNAGPLDLPGDQPHGLIANPSARREQHGIDAVGLQFGSGPGGRLRHEGCHMVLVDMPHES